MRYKDEVGWVTIEADKESQQHVAIRQRDHPQEKTYEDPTKRWDETKPNFKEKQDEVSG